MCPRSRQYPSDIAIGVARIEQTKGRKEETNKQKQLVSATRAVNRAAIPAHSFKRTDAGDAAAIHPFALATFAICAMDGNAIASRVHTRG